MENNFLRKFVSLFDGTEVPDRFATWAGISCLSAMLERRVWLDMNIFVVYPNMFIVFVADAGRMRKSTAVAMTRKLLSKTNPGPRMIAQKTTPEALIDALKVTKTDDQRMSPYGTKQTNSSNHGSSALPPTAEVSSSARCRCRTAESQVISGGGGSPARLIRARASFLGSRLSSRPICPPSINASMISCVTGTPMISSMPAVRRARWRRFRSAGVRGREPVIAYLVNRIWGAPNCA